MIAVLWVLAVLTLMATVVTTASVGQRRRAAEFERSVKMDALADSAIRVELLAATNAGGGASKVHGEHELALPNGAASIRVERERGRLDINTADADLLQAFFAANGWSSSEAVELVNRVLDWRDADNEPRAGSFERSDYLKVGLNYGPRNGPLQSAYEIRQIVGLENLPDDLLECLTVFSHNSVPDIQYAPPQLRKAMEVAERMQLGGHRWLPVLEDSNSVDIHSLSADLLRITACAKGAQVKRCRQAIVRVTEEASEFMQVFEWRSFPMQ